MRTKSELNKPYRRAHRNDVACVLLTTISDVAYHESTITSPCRIALHAKFPWAIEASNQQLALCERPIRLFANASQANFGSAVHGHTSAAVFFSSSCISPVMSPHKREGRFIQTYTLAYFGSVVSPNITTDDPTEDNLGFWATSGFRTLHFGRLSFVMSSLKPLQLA